MKIKMEPGRNLFMENGSTSPDQVWNFILDWCVVQDGDIFLDIPEWEYLDNLRIQHGNMLADEIFSQIWEYSQNPKK